MTSIKTILCPTDFSEQSRAALAQAEELARSFDAELIVTHVVAPMIYPVAFAVPPVIPDDMEEQTLAAAREGVASVVADLGSRGVRCRALVEIGTPALHITDLVEREHVDLVVMSTHGHTGLSHALLGSVAERVVRLCPCPVLTVKAPRHG